MYTPDADHASHTFKLLYYLDDLSTLHFFAAASLLVLHYCVVIFYFSLFFSEAIFLYVWITLYYKKENSRMLKCTVTLRCRKKCLLALELHELKLFLCEFMWVKYIFSCGCVSDDDKPYFYFFICHIFHCWLKQNLNLSHFHTQFFKIIESQLFL